MSMFDIDPLLLVGIGASFILGAFSYIIIQFWVRPISRYRKLKQKVASNLKCYSPPSARPNEEEADQEQMKSANQKARKHSVSLSDLYNTDLPPWYRMVLDNREEFPIRASQHLMTLSNTRDEPHIQQRVAQIRESLHI